MPRIFLTVGTTRFDKLVNAVLMPNILRSLVLKGYDELLIQSGKSRVDWEKVDKDIPLHVSHYDFKPNLLEDIDSADLVISHAGAGTCLEVLRHGKPSIVVINEDLMDNHQVELAEKLSHLGYLKHCVISSLLPTLEEFDAHSLVKYPDNNLETFAKFVESSLSK